MAEHKPAAAKPDLLAKAEREAIDPMDQLETLQTQAAAQGSSVGEIIAAAGRALLGLNLTP